MLIGDAKNLLPILPPASVHLIVTSPPYWNIKDYDHPDQIGYHQSYPDYLSSLQEVWNGCNYVLHPGCKIAINIGDQFLKASPEHPYQIVPIHSDIIQQFQRMSGYTFLGNILWQKITNSAPSGGGTWMGSCYHPRDGYVTYEHEYILLFKKEGKAPKPTKEQKEQSKLTKEQRSLWFRGIWSIPGEKQKQHPAAFPLELPNRLIRMFSFAGETVLDPFAGSGTTIQAAALAGRKSIGIELNPRYSQGLFL